MITDITTAAGDIRLLATTHIVLGGVITTDQNVSLTATTGSITDVDTDNAVDIVERRVNAFGVAESITERVGDNRISVQLPGISSEEAVDQIGRTAQLTFRQVLEIIPRNQPAPTPTPAHDPSSYAAREAQSKQAQEFQGGQTVVVFSGAALVALLLLIGTA